MTAPTSPDTDAQVAALMERLAVAEQNIEAEKAKNRRTALLEMVEDCHDHFHKRFRVEPNPAKTTRGSITKPEGRKCPAKLQPWLDFPQQQSDAFGHAYDKLYPPDAEPVRAFDSRITIKEMGDKLEKKHKTIASEEDLKGFQIQYVDPFVSDICETLGSAVSFVNTSHALEPSPTNAVEAPQTPPTTNPRRPTPKIVNADQFCVYVGEAGQTELSTVTELKAPHKLTVSTLRVILDGTKDIDVIDVRDEHKIPNEEPAKSLYHARRLVAAAATQIYDYMLDLGCIYGCIITGEAYVFLKIDEEDTTTLQYHLAEPNAEVTLDETPGFQHSKTSIAQLASFCMMASECKPHPQDWIKEAKLAAHVWIVSWEKVYEATPSKQNEFLEKLDKKDLSYSGPKVVESYRTPIKTRKGQQQSCKPEFTHTANDYSDSDDEAPDGDHDLAPAQVPSTLKLTSHSQGKKTSDKEAKSSGKQEQQQQRSYCTQSCLLGLVRGQVVDEACPNASSHPRGKQGKSHSLTKGKLCKLLREQLARTMNQDCENLKLNGARGMLFKLCLASHGYTFVGKATIEYWIPELTHEGRVYQRLRKLQGHLIPVYLGNIDLETPWYGPGVHLVHMLLMSYAGESIKDPIDDQEQQETYFENTIAVFGVRHRDMRFRNMLWSRELEKLMFIDFERSAMATKPKVIRLKVTGEKETKLKGTTQEETESRNSISKESSLPLHQTRTPKRKATKRKVLGELSASHSQLNNPSPRISTIDTSDLYPKDSIDVKSNSDLQNNNLEAPIVEASTVQ
ncbi:MAG: hypothetical protein Q9166_007914 [cf. Caloplaca sp. 2 TL-2023]